MKTLSKKTNFLGLTKEKSSYDTSEIVIYSAPFEKTVSYGRGTRNGPKEILKASHYVEFYDEEFDRELCFEKGIAALPISNFDSFTSVSALKIIEKNLDRLILDEKFVVLLGGEHTVTLGSFLAHNKKYENLSILQIDAHSDLRDSYEGSKYSHACVMKRIYDNNQNITQVGIRAQANEESDLIKEGKIRTFYAREIRKVKKESWIKDVVNSLSQNVYLTFDIDGFDPSVVSATGTPEPGGLFWDETLDLLRKVGKERNIVGFDLVELAPSKYHPTSNFIAAKLVYKILNYAYQ